MDGSTFVDDDRGATAVEYSVIASAIAAVIVVMAIAIGAEVQGLFQTLADLL